MDEDSEFPSQRKFRWPRWTRRSKEDELYVEEITREAENLKLDQLRQDIKRPSDVASPQPGRTDDIVTTQLGREEAMQTNGHRTYLSRTSDT